MPSILVPPFAQAKALRFDGVTYRRSRQRLLFHIWNNGIEDELTVEIDSLPCTVNALGGALCLTKPSDAWSREKVSLSYAWKEEPQAE